MSTEFYILVNINNLNYYENEDGDTFKLDRAMRFYTYDECNDELAMLDDDVRGNYAVYKVVQQLTSNFERVV